MPSSIFHLSAFRDRRKATSDCERRRQSGLLTISEMVGDYSAIRRPRGPYRIPLPSDLIERGGQS